MRREHVPRSARTGGRPLEARERSGMERTFGHDLGRVRVHTESPLAAYLGATAFTVGHDVFFGPGQYVSGHAASRARLAHEVTHVMQNARAHHAPRSSVSDPSDHAEREASQVEHAVARGPSSPIPVRAAPSAVIHRPMPGPDTAAPIADYSREPRLEILNRVKAEARQIVQARLLIPWIKQRLEQTFTQEDIFKETALMKQMSPEHKTAADLDDVIDLLIFHEVLKRVEGGKLQPITEMETIKVDPSDLPDYNDPKTPRPGQVKILHLRKFEAAEQGLPELQKYLEKRAPEAGLRSADRKTALKTKNPKPIVETAVVDKDWNSKAGDLNEAAKSDPDGYGVIGWRAIYNDAEVQTAANAKYGANRVITTPDHEHGPGAKTHIHLDLRPVSLDVDQGLGHQLKGKRVAVDPKTD